MNSVLITTATDLPLDQQVVLIWENNGNIWSDTVVKRSDGVVYSYLKDDDRFHSLEGTEELIKRLTPRMIKKGDL